MAEALLLVVTAAFVVRLVPLPRIGRLTAAGPFGTSPVTAERHDYLVAMVRWAVDRAAKRSPFRALCFEQGIAAQIMLRRRGIDSTLLYGVGVAKDGVRAIRAHVWIETDRLPVIGDPEPGDFALLATWPVGRSALWTQCRA